MVTGGLLALLAMVLFAAPAAAQTITGSSVSPTTYSGSGQTITFTVTVNSGNKVASSATVTSQIGAVYTCPIANTVDTGVTFTCTGTYTTTASDVAATFVQERPDVRLLSFATPTDMTGPILQSNFVAAVSPPTVTGLSPATGTQAGGTSVSIAGTNFSGVTAVSFGGTAAASFTVNSATSITATSPAGSGTVNVTVTTSGGTSASGAGSVFTYTVATVAPAITANPSGAVVIAGNNATFTAAASGTPTPTVQWQVSTNGGGTFGNISGAASTTLTFATTAADNGKQYRAVFTNSAGTATTAAATLTAQTPPAITTQPVGGTAAPGGSISLSAAATGSPTPTASWSTSEDNGASWQFASSALSFNLVSASPKVLLARVVFTNAAGSVTSDVVTLTWAKQDQTITFTSTPPASAVVGGATYTVTATATSGLAVSHSIDPSASSICSIAGSTVSFQAVGTCAINADQAGNTVYNAAPQVQQAFAVGQGANIITFPALSDTPFTSAPPVLGATASSGLPVSYGSNSTGICTVSGGAISFVAAGTCSITASQAGNATYQSATPVTQTFAVTAGTNTITFPALADTAFTSTPPALVATASSGLAISYSSNSTGICTVSGGTISLVTVGTCSITASQAGDGNFAAAAPVTNSFAVTPGANTITFSALPARALGSGSFALTATASSGLAVTYSSTTPAICSVSGGAVNLLAVGTCTVLANQAGNADFQAALQVSQSFEITQAVSTVGLTSSASTVFFGMPTTLTATVSGVSPTGTVQFKDGNTVLGTATLSGGSASFTTSALVAGARQLTASYLGDASNLPGISSAINVTVNARPNPAQDPDTRSSIDSQFRTAQRFARTQMNNVEDRLSQMHSGGGGRDSMNLRFSQTRPQPRNGILGGSQGLQSGPVGYGYGYNDAQPLSGDGAMLAGLNPNAPWLVGAPLGMTPVAMVGGSSGESADTLRAADESLEHRPFRVWASGDVNFGDEQPNGVVEQRFTSSGITVGIDGDLNSNLKLGAAFGFAWDRTRIGTNGSQNDATNGSLTFYGSWRAAPKLFIDGLVGMGYGTIDTTRFSSTGAVFLDGKRDSDQTFAALIGTYETELGSGIEFAPYLRADGIWVHLDPYTETGSPIWALAFQAADENSFSGTAGARVRLPLGKNSGWKLTSKTEYRTRISGDYTQLLDFADIQGVQGSPFAITGQGVKSSTFTGGLGLEGNLHNLMLRLNYDLTTLAGGNISNRISGSVMWRF